MNENDTRKWYISEWHNISTNRSDLKVDGVMYEDIKSIILNMTNRKCVKLYRDCIDSLYKHTVDYNNPHNLTTAQLHTQVIDDVYKYWLLSGNNGTFEEFKEIFFKYVEIATYEELLKGDSYIKVTCVLHVARRIRQHDTDTTTESHVNLLNKVFPGKPSNTEPHLSLYRYLTKPEFIREKYRPSSNYYSLITLDDLEYQFHDNFSIVLRMRYVDKQYGLLTNTLGIFKSRMILDAANDKFYLTGFGLAQADDAVFGFDESGRQSFNNAPFDSYSQISDGLRPPIGPPELGEGPGSDQDIFGVTYFGFLNQTDNVFGDAIFFANNHQTPSSQSPDIGSTNYFGFLGQTPYVFGEGPFFIDSEVWIDNIDVGDYITNITNLGGSYGSTFLTQGSTSTSQIVEQYQYHLTSGDYGLLDDELFFGFLGQTTNGLGARPFFYEEDFTSIYVKPGTIIPSTPANNLVGILDGNVFFGFVGNCDYVFGEGPFYTPFDFDHIGDTGDIQDLIDQIAEGLEDTALYYELDLKPCQIPKIKPISGNNFFGFQGSDFRGFRATDASGYEGGSTFRHEEWTSYIDSIPYVTVVISFRGQYLQMYAEPSLAKFTLPIVRATGDILLMGERRQPLPPRLHILGMEKEDDLSIYEFYREDFYKHPEILDWVFQVFRN